MRNLKVFAYAARLCALTTCSISSMLKRVMLLMGLATVTASCGGGSSGLPESQVESSYNDTSSSIPPSSNPSSNESSTSEFSTSSSIVPITPQSVNGSLTGDIWYEGAWRETHRFNLETGISTRMSLTRVQPSRDGTIYVEHDPEAQSLSPLQSPCSESVDISRVTVRDTRSREELSSFMTWDPISYPIKPSPDGSRLLALSNVQPCEQERNDPTNITITQSLKYFRNYAE